METSVDPAHAVPSRRPLRVGYHLLTFEGAPGTTASRWADILALTRRAEAVGFDAVTLGEHFLVSIGGTEELAAGLRAYAAAGFSQVAVGLVPQTLAGIEAYAPVVELLDRGA